MKKRIFFTSLFFVFLFLGLISKTYNLQISKGSYYSVKAESQNRLSGYLEALRGNIYFTDKNGNYFPAAINKEYAVIFAVPKEIYVAGEEGATLAAEQIASALGLDKEKIISGFLNPSNQYFELAKKATQEQVDAVNNLKIKGIYIDKKNFRFYPFQTIASQLLGFISSSEDSDVPSGRYGAELYFNDELSGTNGRLDGDRIIGPEQGRNINLTIDPTVQNRAETILSDLISRFGAESGSVIVQEPKTGKILAMGSIPSFDPNDYSQYKVANFLNPIVQSVYEPGSVFKVLTMAAGLDSHKLTPDTTYIDKGSIVVNGRTIRNWDAEEKGAHG